MTAPTGVYRATITGLGTSRARYNVAVPKLAPGQHNNLQSAIPGGSAYSLGDQVYVAFLNNGATGELVILGKVDLGLGTYTPGRALADGGAAADALTFALARGHSLQRWLVGQYGNQPIAKSLGPQTDLLSCGCPDPVNPDVTILSNVVVASDGVTVTWTVVSGITPASGTTDGWYLVHASLAPYYSPTTVGSSSSTGCTLATPVAPGSYGNAALSQDAVALGPVQADGITPDNSLHLLKASNPKLKVIAYTNGGLYQLGALQKWSWFPRNAAGTTLGDFGEDAYLHAVPKGDPTYGTASRIGVQSSNGNKAMNPASLAWQAAKIAEAQSILHSDQDGSGNSYWDGIYSDQMETGYIVDASGGNLFLSGASTGISLSAGSSTYTDPNATQANVGTTPVITTKPAPSVTIASTVTVTSVVGTTVHLSAPIGGTGTVGSLTVNYQLNANPPDPNRARTDASITLTNGSATFTDSHASTADIGKLLTTAAARFPTGTTVSNVVGTTVTASNAAGTGDATTFTGTTVDSVIFSAPYVLDNYITDAVALRDVIWGACQPGAAGASGVNLVAGTSYLSPKTTLAAAIVSGSDMTITVADVGTVGFGTGAFAVQINSEWIIIASGGNTGTWTVQQRGAFGTHATGHSNGTSVRTIPGQSFGVVSAGVQMSNAVSGRGQYERSPGPTFEFYEDISAGDGLDHGLFLAEGYEVPGETSYDTPFAVGKNADMIADATGASAKAGQIALVYKYDSSGGTLGGSPSGHPTTVETIAHLKWAVANVLLGADHHGTAYLSFTAGGQGDRSDYPQFRNLQIGDPTAAYSNSGSTYWRPFAGGFVAVNAGGTLGDSGTAAISIPSGTYADLDGTVVTSTGSVNVPSQTAMVLTKTG